MCFTPFSNTIETVDVNLASQGAAVLHWFYVDDRRVELRQPVTDRRTDGFDKASYNVLGFLQYEPQADVWLVLAKLPKLKTPQSVRTRHLLPLAQDSLYDYLKQQQLL